MSQRYEKACSTCKEQIRMENINGKWGAYEPGTNEYHKCGEKKQLRNSVPEKMLGLDQISKLVQDLDLRMKLMESIVIDPRVGRSRE